MSKGFGTGYNQLLTMDKEQWEKYLSPTYPWYALSTPELMDLRTSQAAREVSELHAAIIKVLATRPHIPNAEERSVKRFEKAKAQKNPRKPRMKR